MPHKHVNSGLGLYFSRTAEVGPESLRRSCAEGGVKVPARLFLLEIFFRTDITVDVCHALVVKTEKL